MNVVFPEPAMPTQTMATGGLAVLGRAAEPPGASGADMGEAGVWLCGGTAMWTGGAATWTGAAATWTRWCGRQRRGWCQRGETVHGVLLAQKFLGGAL